jgi:hypothetical protein
MIYAATALHNYLLGIRETATFISDERDDGDDDATMVDDDVSEREDMDMASLRNKIAQSMWDDYVTRRR